MPVLWKVTLHILNCWISRTDWSLRWDCEQHFKIKDEGMWTQSASEYHTHRIDFDPFALENVEAIFSFRAIQQEKDMRKDTDESVFFIGKKVVLALQPLYTQLHELNEHILVSVQCKSKPVSSWLLTRVKLIWEAGTQVHNLTELDKPMKRR